MCYVYEYRCIKKEFAFLKKEYGFKISRKRKGGYYTFVLYKNPERCIKIADFPRKVNPLVIYTYAADSCDIVEYCEELDQSARKTKVRVRAAAEWLRKAIEDHTIPI